MSKIKKDDEIISKEGLRGVVIEEIKDGDLFRVSTQARTKNIWKHDLILLEDDLRVKVNSKWEACALIYYIHDKFSVFNTVDEYKKMIHLKPDIKKATLKNNSDNYDTTFKNLNQWQKWVDYHVS